MKPKLYDEHGNSIKHKIPNPSEKLVDKSNILNPTLRKKIIDLAAKHVGQNTYGSLGRPLMCQQFAILVKHMLDKEKISSQIITGNATYLSETDKFEWQHYWLVANGNEIIDCNIDSVCYIDECPDSITPQNYWGLESELPDDRTFNNSTEFTETDIIELEKMDNETLIWKKQIDESY